MTRVKALQLVLRSSDEAIADLIATLIAERDILAAQMVQMREALEMFQRAEHYQPLEDIEITDEPMWDNAIQQGRDALDITLTSAEAQVKEWRKDAERWQWWMASETRDTKGFLDGCLAGWTKAEWDKFVDEKIAAQRQKEGTDDQAHPHNYTGI
jgi:hypothetical protein